MTTHSRRTTLLLVIALLAVAVRAQQESKSDDEDDVALPAASEPIAVDVELEEEEVEDEELARAEKEAIADAHAHLVAGNHPKAAELFKSVPSLNTSTANRAAAILYDSSEAWHDLGHMLMFGDSAGRHIDWPSALSAFQESADLGNSTAHYHLGVMYAAGLGVDRDPARSLLHFTFSAMGDDIEAHLALGFRYLFGVGVQRDCDAAVMHYRNVAEDVITDVGAISAMSAPDMTRLEDDATGATIRQQDEILEFNRHNARLGNQQAQFQMGAIHLQGGYGLEPDADQARAWLEPLADRNHAGAMGLVGLMKAEGLGFEQDNASAALMLSRAAKKGDPTAMMSLGKLYYDGQGVKQNFTTALKWFTAAAEKGNGDAHFNLGVMHYSGQATKKDYAKALHSFTRSSLHGHPIGMYNVAVMHLHGQGTPRSCQQAAQLFKNVAEKGYWADGVALAHDAYLAGEYESALMTYMHMAEQGFETAQLNAAWLLDRGIGYSGSDCAERALRYHSYAALQGHTLSKVKVGDAFYYGRGTEVDMAQSVGHYVGAAQSHNAQALFNLGYMYENGLGLLEQDFPLAKRYYDQSLNAAGEALYPVKLAMIKLAARHIWDDWSQFQTYFGWSLPVIPSVIMGVQSDTLLIVIVAVVLVLLVVWRQRRDAGVQN